MTSSGAASNLRPQKQTKSTYHRPDPAFTYLLSLFLFLTGLAWGLAYAEHFSSTLWIALVFVLGHFLLTSLIVSTAMFFLVGRVLGKRRQGLFGPAPPSGLGDETLEFGYCFDVRQILLIHDLKSTDHSALGVHSSVSPDLDVSLRSSIPAHASHRAGLLGVEPIRQHHVSHGAVILLRHHFSRLQW